MVIITNDNITYATYKNLYDLLKGKATINAYSTSTQPTVTSAYIDDVQSFPQVVIDQPSMDSDEYVFDRSNSSKIIKIVVDVYTSGSSKNKDRSLLTDDLNKFITEASLAGIMLTNLSNNPSMGIDNDNKVLNSTVSLTFVRR